MTYRFRLPVYLYALIMLLGAGACKKKASYDMPESAVSLYDIVKDDTYNFTTFRYIIDRAGLSDLYKQGGEYTVFAPTSSAFAAAGYNTAHIQATSMDSLVKMIKNHIVQGKIDVRTITGTQELTALSGEKIKVQKIGNAIYVDGADITNPKNVVATNGILNVINKPLVTKASILERISTYANSTSNAQLTFCAAAITRASEGSTNFTQLLSDPNSDLTFFAPNNGAFIDSGYTTIAKIQTTSPEILANLLKYQLIQGRKTVADLDSTPVNALSGVPIYFDRLKPATTTYSYANGIVFGAGGTGNMFAAKGVIHIVSRIFSKPITTNTITRIKSDTSLTFFDAALTRASTAGTDYVKMLTDATASYTVYAINNQAFRNAGYSSIGAINAENAAVLSDLLKFHFVNKRQNSVNVAENGTFPTLLVTKTAAGADYFNNLTITKTGGYKVKGSSNPTSAVVKPGDVTTTNGLLNVVDLVLLP